jgi:prepilin-type N-terminal cleavage/methylation domain-containing protein
MRSQKGWRGRAGFTLVELLVALGLLALLSVIAVPATFRLYQNQELNAASERYHRAARHALFAALSNVGEQNWGVRVGSGTITIYRGASYGSRDPLYDETVSVPEFVSVSGVTEVNFARITGVPNVTGNTTFSFGGRTLTVDVNQYGRINFP